MVLAKQFFYDHFAQDDICGMYNAGHFFTIVLFAVLLVLALFLSRNLTGKQFQRLKWVIAIGMTVMEIIKISLRVYKGQGPDSWVPLYYCSLFLFAVWAAMCKNTLLQRTGYSYMTMGGTLAAIAFTFYPSTSLAMFPLWHPATWHSFFFHLVMCYTGLLVLIKGEFVPTKKDAIGYGVFILTACIPSYFLNEAVGTNCMFLHNAFKLPILDDVLQFSHPLYMLIVILAQAVGMYWLNYGLYRLLKQISIKKEKGEDQE
jgi:hypothetical protein